MVQVLAVIAAFVPRHPDSFIRQQWCNMAALKLVPLSMARSGNTETSAIRMALK